MNYCQVNILAIDTSCDETSVAVLSNSKVLSSINPSQSKLHSKYGGVVPSLAKLEHQKIIDSVIDLALNRAKVTMNQIDIIAVTIGPGLAIALEVGIIKAKSLSQQYNKKIIGINHMAGHLFSGLIGIEKIDTAFPSLGVLVSGGHTEILLLKSNNHICKIGETLDDACGECFDKCGRMMGFGYPAGKIISKIANEARKNYKLDTIKTNQSNYVVYADDKNIKLPVPMSTGTSLDMSFSGLKTAFGQLVTSLSDYKLNIDLLCLLLESAAYEQIIQKVAFAINTYRPKSIFTGGGVLNSNRFRSLIGKLATQNNITYYLPEKRYSVDNAAMIGLCAYLIQSGIINHDLLPIDRNPNLSFSKCRN
jgi:N6-L-threonylcarbamoyladenine synthase